ncbi:MAG: RsmB/NOP family class I SAM-dependent RNA methyltransferase [Candidatus Woesearchaeota archaeon]
MELKHLKENFEQYFSEVFGEEFLEIKKQFFSYKRKAIRANTIKIQPEKLYNLLTEKGIKLEKIPFIDCGFFLETNVTLGNLLEHSLGYFYVQDASSMIPPLVLDPKPGELVLDVAAAPGSKTTQMAAMMNNEGLIIANDVSGDRLSILAMNLQRMGVKNVITVLSDASVEQIPFKFDKILLDAPCSATGTISIDEPSPAKMWNPKTWKRLSKIQLKLLNNVWNFLKVGGILVYSTCSIDPMEDEYVITEFLTSHDDAELIPIELNIKRYSPIKEFHNQKFHENVDYCLRILPHFYQSEGFFVAKLKKKA